MKFALGFTIIFVFGICIILGIAEVLTNQGYSELQITIAKGILLMVLISIPPILLWFGGRNNNGENKIEQIGSPIDSLFTAMASIATPTFIIIFLLIIIVNILVWK